MQPAFDFSLPHQGRSPIAKHASWKGAQRGKLTAGSQAARILAAIQDQQPVTDQEIADATGIRLSSVNARTWELCNAGTIKREGLKEGKCGVVNSCWVTT